MRRLSGRPMVPDPTEEAMSPGQARHCTDTMARLDTGLAATTRCRQR